MIYKNFTRLILSILITNSNLESSCKKIGFYSSWNIPCGIAMYTKHLSNELSKRKYKITYYPHTLKPEQIINKALSDKIDIFNIQYDVGLMPSIETLKKIIIKIRNANIKIILTAHWEHPNINQIIDYLDILLMHKEPVIFSNHPLVKIIPMGAPISLIKEDKNKIRRKYGYSPKDKILISIGFMLDSKEPYLILDLLGPFIKKNPNIKLQLLHAFTPRYMKNGELVYKKINNVITKHNIQNQITIITTFISQEELTERIYCSDLGYQWFRPNSQATSASAREYITAQTPLIIPDSSHFHDLSFEGIFKSSMNIENFTNKIINTISYQDLHQFKSKLKTVYNKLNYNNVINQYIEILNSL